MGHGALLILAEIVLCIASLHVQAEFSTAVCLRVVCTMVVCAIRHDFSEQTVTYWFLRYESPFVCPRTLHIWPLPSPASAPIPLVKSYCSVLALNDATSVQQTRPRTTTRPPVTWSDAFMTTARLVLPI